MAAVATGAGFASPVEHGTVATPRFRILYTAKSHGAAQELANRIEATRDQLVERLGRDWSGVTEIRIGVGRSEMEALALHGKAPPQWAAALAYPNENVVLLDALTLSGASGELTLRHELAHVALGRLAEHWPRWFQEGMAMYLTGDRFSPSQYASLFEAVTQDRVFHFEDLSSNWPDDPADVSIAYAQSVAFVSFLTQHHTKAELGLLLDAMERGEVFETAFAKAFRASVYTEEQGFRRQLYRRYSWFPILTATSVQWSLLAFICIVAFVRRRRERARRRAQMEQEEAWEEAASQFPSPEGPSLDEKGV